LRVNGRSLLVAALCSLAVPARAGNVTGRVELLQKGGRRVTDLSDVVVYLDGVKTHPRPTRTTVTMKGKAFLPRVTVVPVGGTVDFPNQDPIYHNVFSVSGENRFDLDLYRRPKSASWTFESPGLVRVYCNIHPQMSAVVLVRDNAHFTRATADGSFTLEGVPAGRYTLKAWQERAGEVSQAITVPAEGDTRADLLLDASSYKRVTHKRKDGSHYGPGEKY
jgi:plastocyanin